MKRRVARIGPSTLMVSLPNKWVKRYGIKKGDEVEVLEKGRELTILMREFSKERKDVDLSKVMYMIRPVVSGYYKAGYDEIKVFFNDSRQLEIVLDTLLKSCSGYEVVEHTKNYLIIKDVAKINPNDFDIMLRRLFNFLVGMSEENLEAVKFNDKERLKNVILMDRTVNNYATFCRRVINKGFITNGPYALYAIVEELEKIGDIYTEVAKNIGYHGRVSKEIISLHIDLNKFLKDFYNAFYDFNVEKIDIFTEKKNEFLKKIEKIIPYAQKKDLFIICKLNEAINRIFDLRGPLLTYNIHIQ